MKREFNKFCTHHIYADVWRCRACWKCVEACPKQVIGKVGFMWHKHIVVKNAENCTGCKKCIRVCPYGVFRENIGGKKRDVPEASDGKTC